MKKRIIVTATLAVLFASSSPLMAANNVDAYQKGSLNDVTVTQSGLSSSSTAIDQNGSDLATITQVSNTLLNVVTVVQDANNTASIDQQAGGNAVAVNQTSLITTTVGAGLHIGGTAAGNVAEVVQYGADNALTTITQSGNNNLNAIINQDTDNSATITQSGSNNIQAGIFQTSGTVSATLNAATINQQGGFGTTNITQSTSNNTASVVQDSTSSNAVATVTQSGMFNIASISQSNTYNTAIVVQSGTAGAGSENNVTITQDGFGLSGAADTAVATQLTGDLNSITINQHRGDGSNVTVTQDGSSNTATVTQN
jgi:hypothetical protein